MTTVSIYFMLVIVLLQRIRGYARQLGAPDYESQWHSLRAQNPGRSDFHVKHGLGEVPLLVDVQVQTLEEPNKNFIFSAVGGSPRDDDMPELYGGVIYIYNEQEVILSSPIVSDGHASGSAIYTANDSYFSGPNNQVSDEVQVRVRAWKSTSLPEPDFSKLDVLVEAGSTDVNKTYVEVEHGFGEYPGLVKVRTQLLDGVKTGYLSDAIGASLVTFSGDPTSQTAHVVHGFNNRSLRVWISSANLGLLFKGTDGYKIPTAASIGRLEMFAWRVDTLPPMLEKTTQLGPNIANETFEMSLTAAGSEMFVQVWAESLTGPNAGYRFPGSGSLAYAETYQDPVCTYGGLMYGYAHDIIRFWRPSKFGNAGIICISSLFGQSINTQRGEDASIVVSVWTSRRGAPEWKEVENKCVHILL